MSSLTEDGPNDLVEELVRGEVLNVSENGSPDEESENWESWMPDPVDVDPSKCIHAVFFFSIFASTLVTNFSKCFYYIYIFENLNMLFFYC